LIVVVESGDPQPHGSATLFAGTNRASGKAAIGRVWFDVNSTTLKYPKKDIGVGLLRAMCRDLGIDPKDL
jgi:hypothetical protein